MVGDFWFNKMELSGEGEHQLLQIELEHSETLQIFEIGVDLRIVKEHEVFGPLADSLEQFKELIEVNFGELKATG